MDVFIGIDVAKEVHRACAMDRNARVLFSHAVDNDPGAIGALIDRIEALEARATQTAVDMLGGAASLVCAMFAEAGLPLVHTPGLAVNRARRGIRGGERKSDPKDAAVIAELARTRPDLRAVEPPGPRDRKMRVGQRPHGAEALDDAAGVQKGRLGHGRCRSHCPIGAGPRCAPGAGGCAISLRPARRRR